MHKSSPHFIAAVLLSFCCLFSSLHAAPRQPIAFGAYYYDRGRLAPADASAISDLRNRSGRLPAVFMIYQSWTGSYSPFPWREARGAKGHNRPLLICWEPWSGRNSLGSWTCDSVTAGRYDAYLTRYAREARRFGGPVMMRLAHEMNGDWYPWATAYTSRSSRHNGNSPADYVAMWRHVVRIFRAEGANNVSWVWSPNIFYMNAHNTERSQIMDLRNLYPGDDWVDWIGLSVYNDGARRPWRSFSNLLDGAYRTVTQISPKPLMIAEVGVTEQGAPQGTSKAQWIQQTLQEDIPNRYPRIRLVNWFCRDKTDCGESNYRFDSSPRALAAFRAAVNSPLYQGTLTTSSPRPYLALATP